MTREEAKKRMEICRDFLANNYSDIGESNFTAFNMAIQALSQEPCDDATLKDIFCMGCEYREQGPCENAISRQAAIDAMYALCDTGETLKENQWRDNPHIDVITNAIDNLPPVTQKSGKWIEMDGYDGDVYYDCSECGESWATIEGTPWDNGMKYCPNCGAKMESEEE